MSDATYVPDGDPCPKHGLKSRLFWAPVIGQYSQCQGCINAFLDWFGGQQPAPLGAEMPSWRAQQVRNAPQAPAPDQFELGVSL